MWLSGRPVNPDSHSELLVVVDGVGHVLDDRAKARHALLAHAPLFEDEADEVRRAAVAEGGGRRFRRVRILATHPEARERTAAELAGVLPEYARPRRIYTSTWLHGRRLRWRGSPISYRRQGLRERALAIIDGAPIADRAEPFTWYAAAFVALPAEAHTLFICPNPWSLLTHVEVFDTTDGGRRWRYSSTGSGDAISKGWERRPERWRGEIAQLLSSSNIAEFPVKRAEGVAGRHVVEVRAQFDGPTSTFAVDARTGIFYVAAEGTGTLHLSFADVNGTILGQLDLPEQPRRPLPPQPNPS